MAEKSYSATSVLRQAGNQASTLSIEKEHDRVQAASERGASPHGPGTRFTLLHLSEQAGNPDGAGTTSRHIGNPSHDTGTPAQVCSKQVTTLIKLYERNIDRVYHYFYSRVSNVSEAEVLTSETFTRVIEALTRGHYVWRGAPFGAWLLGIGTHVLQERNRGLKHTQVTEGLDDLEYSLSPRSERDVLDIIVEREERDAL